MSWAKDHMTWNTEWHNVVWSDEKKFNLDGPDGFSYYWHDLRKEEQLFSKRAMGGDGLMIWASFGWHGKTEIVFLEGRIDAKKYQETLKNHLLNNGAEIGGENWIYQQDNAPIHKAKVTIAWLKRQNIRLLPWPALSPDLNPIENLWGLLVRKVYRDGRQFRTKEELKKAIIASWNEIRDEELQKLVTSMPDRIFQVIRLNGAKTKY